MVNWRVLSSHLWDLKDKRISTFAYLIASGFQMMHVPIISITVSLAINYAVIGWDWNTFWAQNMFIIMTTITAPQLGKTILAVMPTFEAVSTIFHVLIYFGFVVSRVFINPNKFPSGARWLMYLSLFFWGSSGNILSMCQHSKIKEKPC